METADEGQTSRLDPAMNPYGECRGKADPLRRAEEYWSSLCHLAKFAIQQQHIACGRGRLSSSRVHIAVYEVRTAAGCKVWYRVIVLSAVRTNPSDVHTPALICQQVISVTAAFSQQYSTDVVNRVQFAA